MSEPEVLVSVIMITYNQEAFIDEAIRSVVKQHTTFPYELVIANDASTDATAEHCRLWAERYPDIIRFVDRKENLGLQRNYLDAYARCRGKYIAICEGDDWWCSRHKLQRQVDYMEAHPECAVCFHRVVNYYADKHTMSLSNGGQKPELTLHDLSKANVITNLSVMYRAIPAEDIPGWMGEIALFDYAMHSLHAARGVIHYINRPMAVYRQYSGGIWSGNRDKGWLLAMEVRERLMDHFASQPDIAANYGKAYRQIALSLAVHYIDMGNKDNADKIIRRLLSRMPADMPSIQEAINKRRSEMGRSERRINRIRKSIRGAVSKLIPLPRIL